MKFGVVVSAVAFGAILGASPVSASVVDLHTLHDGNTFWGNGHSNSSLSSSSITDTYNFKLSSTTGVSSLTVFDGFLGFSGVSLELFSGSGASATEIESVTFPSLHGSDPLILSDSDLTNGRYELKVIDILPPATEEKVRHHWVTFPTTGGYVLDFDVHNASLTDPPSPTSAVPEPSTWAMVMLGFCGLAFLAHRRRDAAKALVRPA
jgi:hypothetical protein